jgi:hypothetical protein
VSRKGNPYDNALAESFVATLKTECFGRSIPPTKAAARLMVFDYIETFYKRSALINDLLSRESYVSHFYNYWADILRLKSTFVNTANVVPAAYAKFIKESLRANKPYDQFVREMLSARGYAWDNGAVGYYGGDPEMPLDNMAITSRICRTSHSAICARCASSVCGNKGWT